jgi:hypothetical protein
MKRFTATEKWEKDWFTALSPKHKCLWQLLCDRCDAAGVWSANYRLASFLIGATVTKADIHAFGDHVTMLPGGDVLIPTFVEFQYGKLSKDCMPHKPIFRALEKHGLEQTAKGIERVSIPLSDRVLDKDKEEDKDTDKDGGCKGVQLSLLKGSTVIPPVLQTPEFEKAWTDWLGHLKQKRKPATLHAQDLQLAKLAPMGPVKAIETLHYCIEKNWQGIYEPNQQHTAQQGAGISPRPITGADQRKVGIPAGAGGHAAAVIAARAARNKVATATSTNGGRESGHPGGSESSGGLVQASTEA